jgi:hypothetical protein
MPTDITKIKPQLLVQDEGADLTRRDIIDFVGAGVTATDDALNNKTIVTIPGGGGGASGKIGISDNTGSYTFYDTLTLALASAVSGDNIVFFTNIVETNSTSVALKDGVNINLNGYSYTYDQIDNNNTLTDNAAAVNCSILNGTIRRINASTPTTTAAVGLRLSNTGSNIFLSGVTIEADNGSNTCYISAGNLTGGNFRQIGASGVYSFFVQNSNSIIRNINVHADTTAAGIFQAQIFDSNFRNDGNFSVILDSNAIGYRISGYSTANDGIVVGTAKLYNSTGRSTVTSGIDTGTAAELYNCSGYSSGGAGIFTLNYAENCVGSSTATYGMATGSNSKTYNCTGRSSSLYGIFSRGLIVKTSAISTYNNSLGHAFSNVENNDELIDCYAEVANASAYGVNAPTTSPYVTGFSGRGMTQLLNLLSNAQSNTEDNFGNILIG